MECAAAKKKKSQTAGRLKKTEAGMGDGVKQRMETGCNNYLASRLHRQRYRPQMWQQCQTFTLAPSAQNSVVATPPEVQVPKPAGWGCWRVTLLFDLAADTENRLRVQVSLPPIQVLDGEAFQTRLDGRVAMDLETRIP